MQPLIFSFLANRESSSLMKYQSFQTQRKGTKAMKTKVWRRFSLPLNPTANLWLGRRARSTKISKALAPLLFPPTKLQGFHQFSLCKILTDLVPACTSPRGLIATSPYRYDNLKNVSTPLVALGCVITRKHDTKTLIS